MACIKSEYIRSRSTEGWAGRRVVDTLPKHWGGAGSAAIPGQLQIKINSHAVLVDTLQQAGVLSQLPPSAIR